MAIIKSKRFTLRSYRKGDGRSLVESINNKKIYRNTLEIPYSYTLKDAKEWIVRTLGETRKIKRLDFNLAIDIDGQVVGGIGFSHIEGHKAEIGYWLAEKHWGKGIMTEAVQLITKFGFKNLKLRRIYAPIFSFNKASARVLEKNGYQFEGVLRKNFKKDKKFIDSRLLAKVK